MTQTSGKTGPGVGVGREKRGSGGPDGGGVASHPSFQAVEAQISGRMKGGGRTEDRTVSSVISSSLLGTVGKVELAVPSG